MNAWAQMISMFENPQTKVLDSGNKIIHFINAKSKAEPAPYKNRVPAPALVIPQKFLKTLTGEIKPAKPRKKELPIGVLKLLKNGKVRYRAYYYERRGKPIALYQGDSLEIAIATRAKWESEQIGYIPGRNNSMDKDVRSLKSGAPRVLNKRVAILEE